MSSRLDSQIASLLFKQAPFASLSIYLLLLIVLYLFWEQIPHSLLMVWFGANLLVSSLLLVLTWRFNARPVEKEHDVGRWVDRYVALVFVQDLSWGMIGPLSFLGDDPLYRMITLFMLAGMAAGAVTTRGIVFRAYAVSIGTMLAPILVTLMLQSDAASRAMLALTIIFAVFMLLVARNYGQSIRRSTLLWLDNEALVAEYMSEIDHRKKIEQELVGAKQRAENASQAKNQFLANISHELRTPLNGIVGFSAVLGKEKLPDALGEYVEWIRKSASTLLNIVNDMLDITSIEAGHLKLHERPFSLRAEVGEVVAVARTLAEARAITLNVEIDPDVPNRLEGDPDRLKQVITNVLGNAVKYTEQGSVTLTVTQGKTGGGATWIAFEVTDTGIGIPVAAQATLFENFTRAEAFEGKRYEGVGLGMAIAKNLLDAMGGTIDFESVEGEGTTFTFALPLTPCAEHEPLPADADTRPLPSRGNDLSGIRALVVDDHAMNRMVLTAFLRPNGVDCTEASSGAMALQLIAEEHFDVALIDIQMPDMTGIEVARQLIAWNRPIPLLAAVTAHALPEERRDILAAGFAECLIKPIAETELLAVLSKCRDAGAAVDGTGTEPALTSDA